MKKVLPSKKTPNFQGINNSVMPLDYNKRQNYMGSLETMGEEDSFPHPANNTQFGRESADDMNKEFYRPAVYDKAVAYKQERSYLKKSENEYKELDLFSDTDELKYFGLGTYFYIEFFRRLTWLFFVMALVQGITILINLKGDGLSNYEASFSTYLIKTTIGIFCLELGNFSGNSGTTVTQFDSLLVAGIPAINFLALFIFALIWKVHRKRTISKQEQDNTDVKPQKFAIQFGGFDEDEADEEQLKKYFSNFGPVFEASYVRNHQNNLGYFEDLDSIEQQIREQQHEIILGSGSQSDVDKLKKKKAALEKQALEMNIHPTTISAYVHFQFQKTKKVCLEQFKSHYLYDKCSHTCFRTFCCCCLPDNQDKVTFKDNKLLVRSQKVPAAEDINWDHFELTTCSRIVRGCFATLVIFIFLAISCAIIGLCSIYISSRSNNCEGLNISSYTAATATATANSNILQCFCNAHLIDSFTDSTIKTACADYLTGIYVEQSIQYVVIFTSSFMNFMFGLIVDKIVNCVRPVSQDSALSTKTLIYTIFLILNSIVVPILIYADIFGFQASSYVSFVTLASSSVSDILKVSNISFYPNFTSVWYRNVSPIFTNFIIFNTVIVWIFFLFDKCCFADKSHLEKKEGKILQKRMNREITSYKLDIYKEMANLYLVIIMSLLFFAGIPVLLPLGLLNIWSRYISNRSLLQKNSVRVQGLGEDFTSLTSLILTIILIVFPLLGEWMVIANTKVASDFSLIFGSISTNYSAGIYQLQMELLLPFYIGISVLTLVEYLTYQLIVRVCSCLCGCCETPPPNYHTRPFWQYAKGMNILCSYNIRKNDKMRNAVLYLEKYLGERPKI